MNRKNGIILGAIAIALLMISIPLIPALETTPAKTTICVQNFQPSSYIISSTNSVLCPILLAILLGYALSALRAFVYLPEDIQRAIDSYNAGNISALDLFMAIVTTSSIAVINALYAKAGFRFFYNLYHDLCMGPSLDISVIALTSISGIRVSATPSSVSSSTILTSGCGCD